MKFIKLADGSYINAEKILKFFVQQMCDEKFCVYAELGIEDSAALHVTETEVEAQAWLNRLVADLNGGQNESGQIRRDNAAGD